MKSYYSLKNIQKYLVFVFVILTSSLVYATATPANPVYVDTKATSGDGSSGNPWTGWDSTITTWTPGTAYIFRQGWYAYSGTPSGWTQSNMQLLGQPGTVLKCVGCTGAVVSLSNTTTRPQNIHMENFILDGNGTATDGLVLAGPSRSEFNNIRVRNVTTNGFHLTYNILNTFTNPKVATAGETSSTVHYMPAVAMLIDGLSSANTIINPVFEGSISNPLGLATVTQVGFKFAGTAVQNVIVGGTAESLVTGVALCTDSGDVECAKNTFTGLDMEGNTNDIILGLSGSSSNRAYSNEFNNVIALSTPSTGKNVLINSSAAANQFTGGTYSSIYERGQYNTFINTAISGTDAAHLDAYFIKSAIINMRNLSGGADLVSRMPMNAQVGNFGKGLNDIYQVKAAVNSSNISGPITMAGSPDVVFEHTEYVNSNISNNNDQDGQVISLGATVSVGFMGSTSLPANVILSGYVNPSNSSTLSSVVIRWTIVGGASSLPSNLYGTYKVTVMQ